MAPDVEWLNRQADLSLKRIYPRLRAQFSTQTSNPKWQLFEQRLDSQFARLFKLLYHLYGQHYDFFYHLESIIATTAQMWLARPAELKTLDSERENNRQWFHSQEMVGGVCYVDLFAGNLAGVREKIPYFRELGLTYLHLMPLFAAPKDNNDGGYAVSSYRQVNPALGTIEELADLAAELRHNGISLVLDFVFNHTSNEHEWAQRALAGEQTYQDYYYMYPDRQTPDAYDATLREIFPDQRSGSFTWRPDIQRWVWTTFYSFQWDLNYSNPDVFNSMAREMLFLANTGVEVLRLDAVAFIWKQLGTPCENLPEAHMLIQAFNALVQIAAPAMLFKSEAIVHPDQVNEYIHPGECQLSYNPLLMALLWDSLATRKTDLLSYSMRERFHIPPNTGWVNYVRGHDDIGWTFSDEDAAQLGINGYDHRRFLNAFYIGQFAGSFACGLPFQENPKTGDARVAGTTASLAGLEKALQEENKAEVELALRRILLLHSIILSIGGIPAIYLGDELGNLNDYNYRNHPAKAKDSRWVHRPTANWETIAQLNNPDSLAGRIYQQLKHLIQLRKATPALAGGEMDVIASDNPHIFAYIRTHPEGSQRILVLANFSEHPQHVDANFLRLRGLSYTFSELITQAPITIDQNGLTLPPYQFIWLAS